MNDSESKTKFIHLHVHSHYSLLDGLGKIPDLVKAAKEFGMDSLALTDHGTMYGIIEFYEACKKEGIKPILGVETYVAPRTLHDKAGKIDSVPFHLVLLAETFEGYQNLMKLTSIAHLEGYYYKPRVDKETLKKYSAGLIASTACLGGEVPHFTSFGDMKSAEKAALEYVDIFGKDNFFLELQHHPNLEKQQLANKGLIELSQKLGIGLIATNDVHYVHKDDAEAQDALLCLQTGKLLSDTDRMSMKEGGEWLDISFRSPEEMAENFKDTPEAIENTVKIAQRCNVEIELGKFRFPDFPLPENETDESYLRKLIDERLPKIVGEVTEEMQKRIDYEFQVIKDKGYIGYFLIVQDFFQWAKENNIPTNTRGSAAGCCVSYALGITPPKLNPLDFGLPFERFLNPFRPSAPDIDIDIADSGRDALIEYVTKKYGQSHVAQICTFGTMASKAAVRDVARVLGFPYEFADTLSKMIPTSTQTHYIGIKQAIEMVPELGAMYLNDPNVKRTMDLAMKLEGCVRHASVHAAGVVIAPDDITKFTPVMMDTKGDRMVTQYEMHTVGEDGVGLIKMDFLGLANLTIIKDVLKMISKTRNITLRLDDIPLDDKETFKMLAKGQTVGVFQLESEGMRKNIKDLRPTTIHDIMALVALYRPGPMSFIPEYIKRKHNPGQIRYLDPRMEKILDKSLGLIVYQDDVLMIAIELAGYNWQEVDKFRKAIGKKIVKEMAAQKEKFFKQIIERGMEENVANELWLQIETFAGYGFNKAHAASYGLLAYQTAYLKAKYPSEYMAALLTSEQQRDMDKVAVALQECERMKIKVTPPNVNNSFIDYGVTPDTWEVNYALASIKNVGRAVAEEIVEERKRNGKYKDLKDFLVRLSGKVINKKSLESLAMAGALSDLAERSDLLVNMDKILAFSTNIQKIIGSNQDSLFGNENAVAEASIELDKAVPADKKQILAWERELLGMYISEHPLSDVMPMIEKNRSVPLSEITTALDNQFVRVAGIITNTQKILTRSNQNMIFARIEDKEASAEILCFPKTLELAAPLVVTDKIVAIDGFVSFKDGALKILAEAVYEINEFSMLPAFVTREKRRAYGKGSGSFNGNPAFGGTGETRQNTATTKPTVDVYNMGPKILRLTIPAEWGKEHLLELKEIFAEHPGDSSVTLILVNGPTSPDGLRGVNVTKEVKIKNKIKLEPILLDKVKKLVGKDNVEQV